MISTSPAIPKANMLKTTSVGDSGVGEFVGQDVGTIFVVGFLVGMEVYIDVLEIVVVSSIGSVVEIVV